MISETNRPENERGPDRGGPLGSERLVVENTRIRQAEQKCGSCGCDLAPLYRRALELEGLRAAAERLAAKSVELSMKDKAARAAALLQALDDQQGVELKLRKKPGTCGC